MIYTNVKQFIRAKLNRRKQLFIYSQHKKYIRIRAGFDIETTRIGNYAYMYHWQLSWNDDDLLLRKWSDFELLISELNSCHGAHRVSGMSFNQRSGGTCEPCKEFLHDSKIKRRFEL